MQKVLITTLVVGSVAFTGFVFFSANSDPTAEVVSTAQHSGLFTSAQALNHDWGDINIFGGDVSKTFTLMNSEDEPLLLSGAVSSCMCTSAEFMLSDGSRSGVFGMHGGPDWNHMVQPGESFELTVTFDPMAHGPTATGPIARTVNVIGQPNPDQKGSVYTRIDVRGDVLSEEDYNFKYNV